MLILKTQDIKPCGIQQGNRHPTPGVRYQGIGFTFISEAWMDYGAAITLYRSYCDRNSDPRGVYYLLKGGSGYRLCHYTSQMQLHPVQDILPSLYRVMANQPGLIDVCRWCLRPFDPDSFQH